MREQMPPEDQLPPIASHNANATGTSVLEYILEMFGATAFTLQNGSVYQTYATTGRGVEFLPDPRPGTEGGRRGR
jgi:hypothetical protein